MNVGHSDALKKDVGKKRKPFGTANDEQASNSNELFILPMISRNVVQKLGLIWVRFQFAHFMNVS